jgi:hypothetical protein
MTKDNTPQPPGNLLHLPIQSETAHSVGQVYRATAPVLDFRKPDQAVKDAMPYKSQYDLTTRKKSSASSMRL